MEIACSQSVWVINWRGGGEGEEPLSSPVLSDPTKSPLSCLVEELPCTWAGKENATHQFTLAGACFHRNAGSPSAHHSINLAVLQKAYAAITGTQLAVLIPAPCCKAGSKSTVITQQQQKIITPRARELQKATKTNSPQKDRLLRTQYTNWAIQGMQAVERISKYRS